MQIEKSKAAAKAAALKTYTKFQDQIEDYEISDSKSGVYGNVWLWVMPKDMNEMHDFEKKYGDKIKVDDFKNNPKLQQGKTVMYGGTKYKVLENTGYVLTLQSIETEKIKKVNLNQFISQGAIKEKTMKKIKEADTKTYAGVDSVTSMKKDPRYGTLSGDSKIDLEKKLKDGGTVELEEDISVSNEDIETLDALVKMYNAEALINRIKALENTPLAYNSKVKPEDEDNEQKWDDVDPDLGYAQSHGMTNTMENMMEAYMKERAGDNLMEHMDKHKKRARLMEGAWKNMSPMFDNGQTDEEIVQHYVTKGVAPENVSKLPTLVAKFRNNWNSVQKIKTDLEILDQEAEGLKQSTQPVVNGMEGGMEEEKQLSSGIFNETK